MSPTFPISRIPPGARRVAAALALTVGLLLPLLAHADNALLPALTSALIKSDHEVGKVIVSRPVAPLHPAEVEFETFLAAQVPASKPAVTGPDDPGFWLYSSGSTGRPSTGIRRWVV